MNNAEFWATHKPDDAPEWSEDLEEYLPLLKTMSSWAEFHEQQAKQEQVATENADPCLVPGSPWNDDGAALVWRNMGDEDAVLRVYALFTRNISHVATLPDPCKTDHEEFVWSTITTLLCSAGPKLWPKLCHIASQQFGYPYSGEEDFDEVVTQAVQQSKIPVSAMHIPYDTAKHIAEGSEYPDFVVRKACTTLHILKHALVSPDGDCINIIYRGSSVSIKIKEFGESLWHCTARAGAVATQLGIPKQGTKKDPSPWGDVASVLLRVLSPKNLVRQGMPVDLPPCALYGPWTTVVPSNEPKATFFRHEMQLTGAWQASQGRITPNCGDAEDALHTCWDVCDPHKPSNIRAKKEFEAALPTEYVPESPYAIFKTAFPNLDANDDYDALLFDLPIYAELLRPYVPTLRREYPPILFLPKDPTPEHSTNQGKSMATQCVASVMCPGIELMRCPDTNSAPDLRAIADVIRQYGTIALDEWHQPNTESHYFAHDNFQSLVTGGKVAAGRAYENSGEIRLSHSVVLSSKWVEFTDDMVNRCFFYFLDQLSEAQKANATVLNYIRTGRISLLMRLGAWADIEEHDLAQLLGEAPKASGALRYEGINTLAELLCEMRGLNFAEFGKRVKAMQTRYVQHTQDGIDNAMNRQTTNPTAFGLADMFDIGADTIGDLAEFMIEPGQNWATPASFVKALLQVFGMSRDSEYARLLPRLAGEARKMSNRAFLRIVCKVISTRLCESEYMMLPDLRLAYKGWCLIRGKDKGSTMQIKLINTAEEPEWRGTYGVVQARRGLV